MNNAIGGLVVFFFIISSIAITACSQSNVKNSGKPEKLVPAIIDTYKYLYVTDRRGASEREKPDSTSSIRVTYEYGQAVQVRNVYENWVEVGPADQLDGYINAAELGNEGDFFLQQSDLFDGDGSNVFNAFKIEFVSKKKFYSKRDKVFDHFKNDHVSVFKNNGVLELTENNNKITLIDQPDVRRIYEYIGRYPTLYVVTVASWEETAFMLVDQITGKEYFAATPHDDVDFPMVLVDNKHVLVFNEVQGTGCQISLFELGADTIQTTESIFFDNFHCVSGSESIFWGKDNSFYFVITPSLHIRSQEAFGYVKLTLHDNEK